MRVCINLDVKTCVWKRVCMCWSRQQWALSKTKPNAENQTPCLHNSEDTTPNRTCSLWRNAYSSQACNLLLSSCHTKTSHQNRLPNRTCSLWRFCLLKSISLFIEKHIRWGTRACHKAQSCNKQNSLSQWIHPIHPTEQNMFSLEKWYSGLECVCCHELTVSNCQ